jgi:RNA polymerase sigma factor (sigma-70 family)
MSDTQHTEKCTLDAIRRGDAAAWARLVEEYEGRLLRFAQARVPQLADAEDIVQDTFTSLLKAVGNLRIETSLETYLFGILRHEMANRLRTRWARAVCLIQDIYSTGSNASAEALARVAAPGASVSRCVSHNEQHQLQRQVLTEALHLLVGDLQEKRKFRDLKVCELVFYCQLPNQNVARLLGLKEVQVRVIKHRCLKRIRAHVAASEALKDMSISYSEDLLTDIWEARRLSCPNRGTLDAFLRETLSPDWFDYVDFHLTTMGCHFCRASFKDLQEQQTSEQNTQFRQRILTTTAGFLSRPADGAGAE